MKDDISKKIPPKFGRDLIFKGLRLVTLAEFTFSIRKLLSKTLKNQITSKEQNRYRLEKTGMTGDIMDHIVPHSTIQVKNFEFIKNLGGAGRRLPNCKYKLSVSA